jgi:hypothetical protein
MCGAAALCMVYRSFGMSSSQVEIAAKLTRPGPYAQSGARTHVLAQDALARGLSAIVLRASDPLGTLKLCRDRPLRAILNHRPRRESSNGHFTVLVDLEGDLVVVHDPLSGPNTRIRAEDLLQLWQPLGGASEITGNVLVVLAKERQSAGPCPKCGSSIPDAINCPVCGRSVALRPASVLGCASDSCPERAWETVFCPHCDAILLSAPANDLSGSRARKRGEPGAAAGAKPGEIDDDPMRINTLSAEIDKFLALLLSVNGGRPVHGAEQYFTKIRELQGQMLQLHKEQAAERRAKAAQPPPTPATAAPPKPAAPPEPPAAKRAPRPPVDWNELARKLVEEAGYRPR